MTDIDLIAEARKAAQAVYLATDAEVADDISRIILGLVAEVSALREVIEKAKAWHNDHLAPWPDVRRSRMLDAILASVPAVASPEIEGDTNHD